MEADCRQSLGDGGPLCAWAGLRWLRGMRSRHLTGHAVDLAAKVGNEVRWDWPLYHKLAAAMKRAAHEVGVQIEWGGSWKSFPDGPHFQLPWKAYP